MTLIAKEWELMLELLLEAKPLLLKLPLEDCPVELIGQIERLENMQPAPADNKPLCSICDDTGWVQKDENGNILKALRDCPRCKTAGEFIKDFRKFINNDPINYMAEWRRRSEQACKIIEAIK